MNKRLKYNSIVAIAVALIVAMGSCKKKSDDPTPEVVASMSATINETGADSSVVTTTAEWSAITRKSYLTGNQLTITGVAMPANILTPTIVDNITITVNGIDVDTYTLGFDIATASAAAQCGCTLITSYNGKYPSAFISTSGTVNITAVDKTAQRVSGTFEFVVFSGVIKTITNGKFENLKYDIK